jgi:hypothetical protein
MICLLELVCPVRRKPGPIGTIELNILVVEPLKVQTNVMLPKPSSPMNMEMIIGLHAGSMISSAAQVAPKHTVLVRREPLLMRPKPCALPPR